MHKKLLICQNVRKKFLWFSVYINITKQEIPKRKTHKERFYCGANTKKGAPAKLSTNDTNTAPANVSSKGTSTDDVKLLTYSLNTVHVKLFTNSTNTVHVKLFTNSTSNTVHVKLFTNSTNTVQSSCSLTPPATLFSQVVH